MTQSLVKTGHLVTVFGGSGFIGRHVVRALARRGWRVRVASRRPDLAFHLQPAGRVGQIHAVQANLRYPNSIAHALRDAEAVVNLVGILSERGPQKFDALHVEGAGVVAHAAAHAGIKSFVHLSALGVDLEHNSAYARSKARGEAVVRGECPQAVILRPSVVFGPEDQFFNRFAAMARISPALPLIGGGASRLQPVFVGDVGEAVGLALDGQAKPGQVYELGGPAVRSFRELMEFVLTVTGRKRLLVPVPFGPADLMARVTETVERFSFGLFPKTFALSRDQVELLHHDNVVSAAALADGRTLEGLGVAAESFETFAPTYLYRFRKAGQFANQSGV